MSNALISKLRRLHHLEDADIRALGVATSRPTRYSASRTLGLTSTEAGATIVVLAGWVCRRRAITAGARQITSLLMPGDICDMHTVRSATTNDEILTLTTADVVFIPQVEMYQLMAGHPNVARALTLTQLIDEGIMRAWIVCLGRRNSVERVAHLICELHLRARNVGMSDEGGMDLPFPQAVLADVLGITPVHISRSLRQLRLVGAMAIHNGTLKIFNPIRLAEIAGFDDRYLNATAGASA